MKVVILSDSHGFRARVFSILHREEDADSVIFLGDGLYEMEELELASPGLPLYMVRGNCDISLSTPADRLLSMQDRLIFCTHGNGYEVKLTLQGLKKAARQRGADVALFGHTHIPFYEYDDGLYLFNPGSVAASRTGRYTYGVMTLEKGERPRFEHREVS